MTCLHKQVHWVVATARSAFLRVRQRTVVKFAHLTRYAYQLLLLPFFFYLIRPCHTDANNNYHYYYENAKHACELAFRFKSQHTIFIYLILILLSLTILLPHRLLVIDGA